MYLSNNFTVAELSKSNTAKRRGWDNTPPAFAIENLRELCQKVLQPVRNHFALPVSVSSGYRSPNVNRAEGGAFNSQHLVGQAVDFEITGIHNADIWRWIKDKLEFDQLIAEHLETGNPSAGWIHVSYNKGGNRKQAMSCVHGDYKPGLHYEG